MKTFLIKIPSQLKRFFWSRGFLKFCLWVITLVVFFYVEENWRGARAWAAAKAEWEAQGETFDLARLLPPVPENQNLANIPLFKMEPDPDKPGDYSPLNLQRAYHHESTIPLPSLGSWQEGDAPNQEKIRQTVRQMYVATFKQEPPREMTTLEQFDAIYPFVAGLRRAAELHPSCRFDFDPLRHPNSGLSLVSSQINVAKILALHTVLALDAGKPDLALADLKTSFDLIAGVRRTPYVLSALVAVGMAYVILPAFYDGLARHAWNDAELAGLQQEWIRVDFLSSYLYALRTDATIAQGPGGTLNSLRAAWSILPVGWIDTMKAQYARKYLVALDLVNLPKRKRASLSPEVLADLDTLGPISPFLLKSCQAQVWVDEAQIAYALERYRLAHNTYPPALVDLVPTYTETLPHDVITGEPFHYHLRPDGKFLLYSVGWNGKDEGGHVVYQKDNPKTREPKEGDWTWPVPR